MENVVNIFTKDNKVVFGSILLCFASTLAKHNFYLKTRFWEKYAWVISKLNLAQFSLISGCWESSTKTDKWYELKNGSRTTLNKKSKKDITDFQKMIEKSHQI